MGKKMVWLIIIGLVLIAVMAWGPIVSRVEQARYTTVEKYGAIEIRDYAPMIVAITNVSGTREASINQGFRTIAGYIFGGNKASEKIAMTAPVMQTAKGKTDWQVRFVMPANYSMKTLPKPRDGAVALQKIPAMRFAVIRFSGSSTRENLQTQMDRLNAFIKTQKIKTRGEVIYAFYNPPWTFPFFRRNEIMIAMGK